MEAGRAREEAARGGSLKQARARSGRRGDRAHRAADLLAGRGHDEARRSRCTTARSGAAALELWLTVLKSQDSALLPPACGSYAQAHEAGKKKFFISEKVHLRSLFLTSSFKTVPELKYQDTMYVTFGPKAVLLYDFGDMAVESVWGPCERHMSAINFLPPLSTLFSYQPKPLGQPTMGGEKGASRRGQARRRRLPASVAPNSRECSCHVPDCAPNCNCNVFTCTHGGWGFRHVMLPKLLFPKLRAISTELLKSRFVQVSSSFVSSPRRRTHSSTASSSRSTPFTPCCGRVILNASALLPATRHRQASRRSPAFSHPLPAITVRLLLGVAAQRPLLFSPPVVGCPRGLG
uniref:Uncharacterized protein n=1 Tax=Oryza glumipatula TaxID=40148 RepID=A0A0D9Z3M4_9ORYZ